MPGIYRPKCYGSVPSIDMILSKCQVDIVADTVSITSAVQNRVFPIIKALRSCEAIESNRVVGPFKE